MSISEMILNSIVAGLSGGLVAYLYEKIAAAVSENKDNNNKKDKEK